MLQQRLIVGVIISIGFAALVWFDAHAARPGAVLLPLAVVAAWLASGEMLRMFRARGADPWPITMRVGTILPVAAIGVPIYFDVKYGLMGWLMLGTMAGLFVSLIGELRRFTTEDPPEGEPAMRSSIVSIGLGSFCVLYVGVLMSFLVRLRLFDDPKTAEAGRLGLIALGSLIFTVKLSDTGQYAFGKLFGKTKLAPRLSPGKTWEGTLGGIALSTVVSALLLCWYLPEHSDKQVTFLGTAVYCFFLCVIGVVGDLTESLLKRDSGVKDSSDWLPGMGGVLDVVDSLVMTAPLAVLWW